MSPLVLLSRVSLVAATLLAFLALAPAASAAPPPPFPAAGELMWPSLGVRAAPSETARRVMILNQFRFDYRPTIVHAISWQRDSVGRVWYKIRLPIRPFGQTGWVLGDGVHLNSIAERVIVRRGRRVLEVWRGRRMLMRARVAVGRSDRPTPLGRFYVAAKFVPDRNALVSTYALELSAPAGLSDFPGGGVVGIHGTPATYTLGKAASNGCVRVSPTTALRLKRLVPLGAPVRIVR